MWLWLIRLEGIIEVWSGFYVDGSEVEAYGQWGNPASISTGTRYSSGIGKRWDNGQRFVGAIDDVRLYSADFSEF